jgi:Tfp pilus assembly protein PilO
MNIQLSTFNRIIIVGGLFIIIALLGWFFVVQPKRQQEAVTRAEISDLQAQYDELKRVADQKPLYLAYTQAIRARLTGVEVTAQPKTYIPSYMKQIEDLATRDGLNVVSVAPAATPVPSPGPSATPAGSITRPPAAISNLVPGGLNRAAGVEAARTLANQGVLETTGPAGPAHPGATPGPGKPQGLPAGGTQPSTPRAAALAYLNQSFTQVPVSMELDGRYDQFEKFLRDLAKFPKLIGVGDVTLSTTAQSVGVSPRLKIVVPITAYRLSPNAPPGPVATPAPPGGGR